MNDQRRFAGDFARRLYERKGQQRSPLMLMVDEADEFVPQRLPQDHEAMFGAFFTSLPGSRQSGRTGTQDRSNFQAFHVTSGAVGTSPDIPNVSSAFRERSAGKRAER
jgi:hypothetical protein